MVRPPVTPAAGRYTAVAVVLHWLMAAAILFMLGLGFVMGSDLVDKPTSFQLYQLHKSIGIVLLWLIAVRLAWRLTHRVPELTGPYPKWERALAALGHLALYLLMIAMPLSGWLLVSSSAFGLPTMLFGWVQWPNLGFAEGSQPIHEVSKNAHYYFAWALIGLITLHILAVIKHWVIDRQNIVVRMSLPPRQDATKAALLFALCLLATAVDARPYKIDYSRSKLEFAVAVNGEVVKGTFPKWTALIDFDADHPETSKVSAAIDTSAATTNDATRDTTLASADWLASRANPQATFVSDKITTSGFGVFQASGMLTLRGQARPVTIQFKLPFSMATGSPVDGTLKKSPIAEALLAKETPEERAKRQKKDDKKVAAAKKAGQDPAVTTAEGTFTIKRLDYGIGAQSDLNGQWIGLEIPVALTIVATPQ